MRYFTFIFFFSIIKITFRFNLILKTKMIEFLLMPQKYQLRGQQQRGFKVQHGLVIRRGIHLNMRLQFLK
jgi:hypothetical protein